MNEAEGNKNAPLAANKSAVMNKNELIEPSAKKKAQIDEINEFNQTWLEFMKISINPLTRKASLLMGGFGFNFILNFIN